MFNNLNDTVDYMLSDDFKKRFIAEYEQIKIRREKLSLMLAHLYKGELDFKPNCDIDILMSQLAAMDAYLNILKYRAKCENIDLLDVEVLHNANS